MDCLLVSLGSHGDVHPFVGLGAALKARGHDVSLATNGHFESLVRKVGLDFIQMGTDEEFRALAANPDIWKATKAHNVVFGSISKTIRPFHEIIARRVVKGRTLVVASSLALSARIAQDKLGFPMASVHLQPGVFRSVIDPPVMPGLWLPRWLPRFIVRKLFDLADSRVIDPIVAPAVNDLRKELGLDPVSRVLRKWWHSPQLVIGMFPEWYANPAPDWPSQTVLTGFPMWDERQVTGLDKELYDFINAGEPPLVFTPGSAMMHGREFFQTAIDCCIRMHRRGILLTRHREQVPGNLPELVRHFDYAPFSELLPNVAALVHHGGIGTCSQALAAGVRQVVVPMAHDQFDNAARLEKLGVARVIKERKFNGSNLARALDAMIRDRSWYVRCHWVSEWFKKEQPLVQTAVLLEQFAREHGIDSTPKKMHLAV